MPIPKPRKGEKQSDYIGRTIEFLVGEGKDQEQASAIAYQQWENRGKKKTKKSIDEFSKAIPMDMSFRDMLNAIQAAAKPLLPDPKGWVDVIDAYLDGTCILRLDGGGPGDSESSYFQYDFTFNEKEEVVLSNPVKVERTWEEAEEETEKRTRKAIPIFKVDEEKRLVYGIVLQPNVADAQGDIITPDEIMKVAHSFMKDYRNQMTNMGIMHQKKTPHVHIVESSMAPVDFKIGDQEVAKDSWIIVTKVEKDELWKAVKEGKFTGYSIGGRGKRIPVKEEGDE